MEDKEFIRQLSQLRDIKPREDWVILLRHQIIGEEQREQRGVWTKIFGRTWGVVSLVPRPKLLVPALAALVFGVAVVEGASQSLPGDSLYSLRAAAEQAQITLAPEEERPEVYLALAQKRLDDLKKITRENRVQNLHPTIQEFEGKVAEVSGGFAKLVEEKPEQALQASREIVRLQEEKMAVEQILGTKIGEAESSELEAATQRLVEYEIKDLESRSLTPEQQGVFKEAKDAYGNGQYQEALEFIWRLSDEQKDNEDNSE